jgi:hypothetical protein
MRNHSVIIITCLNHSESGGTSVDSSTVGSQKLTALVMGAGATAARQV